MKRICVIGSINVDLVTLVEKFPKPGETLIGMGFETLPGGKGANQAVAAGRLGADISMIARVGNDSFGRQMIEALKSSGVKTEAVDIQECVGTGVACIQVAASGENSIIITPGANGNVTEEYVLANRKYIDESDIVLLQMEIPMQTVKAVVRYASEAGKMIILDPAPAQKLDYETLKRVDVLTPNESEIQTLSGLAINSEEDAVKAARMLIGKGAKIVINKAGKKGAYLITKDEFLKFPTYAVKPVDTTAAGDSFNAGLAVALSEEKGIDESIDFANLVAAISTTKLGAQSAMPTRAECEEFRKKAEKTK